VAGIFAPIENSSVDIGNTPPWSGPATPTSPGFIFAPKPFAFLFRRLVALRNFPLEFCYRLIRGNDACGAHCATNERTLASDAITALMGSGPCELGIWNSARDIITVAPRCLSRSHRFHMFLDSPGD
jgi:hypothetical protein